MLDILYGLDEYGSKFLVEMINEKLVCIWCVPLPIKKHKAKPVRCFISLDSPTKIYELFKLIRFRH